jgi:RNA polymerase primary sigma factor
MSTATLKKNLFLKGQVSGNVLDSFGFECDSENSYYSDEAELAADSRGGNELQEADSQVESEHLLREQPYGNDLMLSYLQDVSRFPLLSPEREVELAGIIKEGEEELVRCLWDKRAPTTVIDILRQQLSDWRTRRKRYPGLREKMVEAILECLREAAIADGKDCRGLYIEAQEVAARISEAKNEMVEGNIRLVISIAKRYRGRGLSLADLIQHGNLGLMKAATRFDHTRGNRFSTYATWWVRQGIIRGIYEQGGTIRRPVHVIEVETKLNRASRRLGRELGRTPTPREVTEYCGLCSRKVKQLFLSPRWSVPLEAPAGSDERSLGELLEDENVLSPLQLITYGQRRQFMRSALASLSSREESILRFRFGIDGIEKETLKSIGRNMNISKERVRQLETKAMRKLRKTLRNEGWRYLLDDGPP